MLRPLGGRNARSRAGATRLTRQHSGLWVLGILVHRHGAAAAAAGKELPRRGELAGHRNRECGPALGAQSARNPPGPGPPRSHLPLQLPGLAQGPALQLQHPVGTDAVEGSASCRGTPARLHPASPQASAGEPLADCAEAVTGARLATTPCSPPGACRLRSGREAREGAWPGWSPGASMEVRREGGEEREDRCGEGRLAPERRRWRLQLGTIRAQAEALNPTWQRSFPREPRARGRGPRAPFWRALAPPPPCRAKEREGKVGRTRPTGP